MKVLRGMKPVRVTENHPKPFFDAESCPQCGLRIREDIQNPPQTSITCLNCKTVITRAEEGGWFAEMDEVKYFSERTGGR